MDCTYVQLPIQTNKSHAYSNSLILLRLMKWMSLVRISLPLLCKHIKKKKKNSLIFIDQITNKFGNNSKKAHMEPPNQINLIWIAYPPT